MLESLDGDVLASEREPAKAVPLASTYVCILDFADWVPDWFQLLVIDKPTKLRYICISLLHSQTKQWANLQTSAKQATRCW